MFNRQHNSFSSKRTSNADVAVAVQQSTCVYVSV